MGLHLDVLQALLRFGPRAGRDLLGLRQRRCRDLLRHLARALEHAAGLLSDPVQGVPHRRLRRAADLQFGDHAIDALHVRIDGATLIAANGRREGHITDLPRHLVPALGNVELLGSLRRVGLVLALAPTRSRLPVGCHGRKYYRKEHEDCVPGVWRLAYDGATVSRRAKRP